MVKNYTADLPPRPKAADFEISTNDTWNFALVLADSAPPGPAPNTTSTGGTRAKALVFDPVPSPGWSSAFPFDDSGVYVLVRCVSSFPRTRRQRG